MAPRRASGTPWTLSSGHARLARVPADSGGPVRFGALLDGRTFPPAFNRVDPGGTASAAGIADGDLLLAIDGVELTPENAEAAELFVRVAAEPFGARVRSKTGSYAIDLNVTPR